MGVEHVVNSTPSRFDANARRPGPGGGYEFRRRRGPLGQPGLGSSRRRRPLPPLAASRRSRGRAVPGRGRCLGDGWRGAGSTDLHPVPRDYYPTPRGQAERPHATLRATCHAPRHMPRSAGQAAPLPVTPRRRFVLFGPPPIAPHTLRYGSRQQRGRFLRLRPNIHGRHA